ncbi:hypothetical protein DND132_2978 [Pseudodesulfovibrio mercurii]|uniref:Uncharacterized protein n=1 Tax=Pseudodesulfovibrio mercurii TaxID=641491 RepID=F0JJT2_9BACT|nr:hypothetical protein [Pseudodesulfovibrio mercurii]EGB16181.1 hypothetical protein DND132_2978 [Pseudodesulfovibrio mercurii]
MRALFFLVAFIAMIVFSAPVWASLPYYNADMGYTIWLPKSWTEATPDSLDAFERTCGTSPVQGAAPDWRAGYVDPHGGRACRLLVEVKPGRRMLDADISNFNRFLVRSLTRSLRERVRLPGDPVTVFKGADYFPDKKTLRIETEVAGNGTTVVSLAYIVYTRKGMLAFTAFVDPADREARQTVDKAVLSLYLDDRLRY